MLLNVIRLLLLRLLLFSFWCYWRCCCCFCGCRSGNYYVGVLLLLLWWLLLLFYTFVWVNRWTNYQNVHTLKYKHYFFSSSSQLIWFYNKCWFTHTHDADNCREWFMNLLNLKLGSIAIRVHDESEPFSVCDVRAMPQERNKTTFKP